MTRAWAASAEHGKHSHKLHTADRREHSRRAPPGACASRHAGRDAGRLQASACRVSMRLLASCTLRMCIYLPGMRRCWGVSEPGAQLWRAAMLRACQHGCRGVARACNQAFAEQQQHAERQAAAGERLTAQACSGSSGCGWHAVRWLLRPRLSHVDVNVLRHPRGCDITLPHKLFAIGIHHGCQQTRNRRWLGLVPEQHAAGCHCQAIRHREVSA